MQRKAALATQGTSWVIKKPGSADRGAPVTRQEEAAHTPRCPWVLRTSLLARCPRDHPFARFSSPSCFIIRTEMFVCVTGKSGRKDQARSAQRTNSKMA